MKNFLIEDKVSFKGSVDLDPIEETVVSWVDNKSRQAIIEHPDGHSGEEIPGRGLDPKKFYGFVKTDHLEYVLVEGEAGARDVVAEEVAENNTAGAGPASNARTESSRAPSEKSEIVISESLRAFKNQLPAENHELIDILIQASDAYEKGNAFVLEIGSPIKMDEIAEEEKKPEIPTLQKSTAEILKDQEKAEKEMNVEQKVKSTEETLGDIRKLVQKGIDLGLIFIGKGPTAVNGEKDESVAAFYKDQALCTIVDKEDLASIAVYFYNVPDELTAFTLDVANASQNPENLDNDTEKADTGSENTESGSENEKSETITYKKKDDKESSADETPKELSKEEYREKLIALNRIGGSMAAKIMAEYPKPSDLMTAYENKAFNYNAAVNKSLKDACKNNYFA